MQQDIEKKWWVLSNWKFALELLKKMLKNTTWYLLPISILPVILIIVSHHQNWTIITAKSTHEDIAVPILAVALCLWVIRAYKSKNKLFILIATQTCFFMCREIHFTGTHKGIYVASALVLLWAIFWLWKYQEDITEEIIDWRFISCFLVVIATYALAIIIQRRFF